MATPADFEKALLLCGRPGIRAAKLMNHNPVLVELLFPAVEHPGLNDADLAILAEEELVAAIGEHGPAIEKFLLTCLGWTNEARTMFVGARTAKAAYECFERSHSVGKRYLGEHLQELAVTLYRRRKEREKVATSQEDA